MSQVVPDPQGTVLHGSGINHMAGLLPLEGRGLAFYAPVSVSHWLWSTLVGSEDKWREGRRFSSAEGNSLGKGGICELLQASTVVEER